MKHTEKQSQNGRGRKDIGALRKLVKAGEL